MISRIGASVLLLLVLIAGAASVLAQEDMAAQVLARINQARAEAGLPPLTRNAELDAAAQQHANDLQKNGVRLGHRGSDGSTIKQRIARAGYGGGTTGENWAAYRTLDQIMDFWLNDPPHRRNVLHGKFRDIGIGVAPRANGGWIVITDFGAPGAAPEMAAPAAVAPTKKAAQKPRATPTKPKPVAPKPTRAPTRQPTAKPTRAKQNAAPPTPMPEPTRVALAAAPKKQTGAPGILRARGRTAKVVIQADADGAVGMVYAAGDPFRMTLGAGLALGGMMLLGVAVIGHWRYRAR